MIGRRRVMAMTPAVVLALGGVRGATATGNEGGAGGNGGNGGDCGQGQSQQQQTIIDLVIEQHVTLAEVQDAINRRRRRPRRPRRVRRG